MIIYYLETAFMLWMLVDAMQRRAEYYWYIIIFVPFGEWAYFFAIKIHDYNIRWPFSSSGKPPSVDKLRYKAKQNPCLANKLALAHALYAKDEFMEAMSIISQIRESNPNDKEAIYGLALCKTSAEEYDDAAKLLEELIEIDSRYNNYAPLKDLTSIRWRQGQKEAAIDLLRKLVRLSCTISHRTLLAQYLVQTGENYEASEILSEVLEDYKQSPPHVKRINKSSIRQAKSLLKQAGA